MKKWLLGLVFLAVPAQSSEILNVSIKPQVCAAPCDAKAVIQYQRHQANRWLAIYVTRKGVEEPLIFEPLTLDADSPTEFSRTLVQTPAGEYTLTVVLERDNDNAEEIFLVKVSLRVVSAQRGD